MGGVFCSCQLPSPPSALSLVKSGSGEGKEAAGDDS